MEHPDQEPTGTPLSALWSMFLCNALIISLLVAILAPLCEAGAVSSNGCRFGGCLVITLWVWFSSQI